MIGLLCFVLAVLASPFKSKLRLEAENAVLRHQLNVVRRRLPGRVRLTNNDRRFLIQLYRLVSINPAGSHNHPARDPRALAQGRLSRLLALEVAPIGRATADPYGTARIDPADECRKSALGRTAYPRRTAQLGFEVAQSSVAKYMVKRRSPPSQGWRTFLRNHAPDIAAMDLHAPSWADFTTTTPAFKFSPHTGRTS
jgi:hypothetical protein